MLRLRNNGIEELNVIGFHPNDSKSLANFMDRSPPDLSMKGKQYAFFGLFFVSSL